LKGTLREIGSDDALLLLQEVLMMERIGRKMELGKFQAHHEFGYLHKVFVKQKIEGSML
jgi:hypothetical protein